MSVMYVSFQNRRDIIYCLDPSAPITETLKHGLLAVVFCFCSQLLLCKAWGTLNPEKLCSVCVAK